MKTLKQILSEMPIYVDYSDEEKETSKLHKSPIKTSSNDKKVADVRDTHDLMKKGDDEYYLRAKKRTSSNPGVHMYVNLENSRHDPSFKKVQELKGHPDSPIKAHEFYQHLLKNGVKIESDDIQTKGGMMVWKKLADDPNIHVTHHNASTGKEIPLDRENWMNNYQKAGGKGGPITYFRATLRK